MRNSDGTRNPRSLIIICVALLTLAALPLLSSARSATAISITITNNSSREIRHVYLSPVNQDVWGSDQINSVIAPGGSATLSNVACDQAEIKVIAEDQDGCFLYQVVSCAGNAAWTITNEASRDCGN